MKIPKKREAESGLMEGIIILQTMVHQYDKQAFLAIQRCFFVSASGRKCVFCSVGGVIRGFSSVRNKGL